MTVGTVTGAPATPPAPAAPAAGTPAAPSRRRRWVWPVVVAGLAVLSAVVTALLVPTADRGALDPRSAAPTGSRAVARVLAGQGVRVDLVERSDAAVDGAVTGDTIVVVQPELLGPRQLERLAGTPADLVLVRPDLTALRALAPGALPAGLDTGDAPVEPGCIEPDAVAAGRIVGGGSRYALDPAPGAVDSGVGCYPAPDGDGFGYLRLRATQHEVTVLGQGRLLQNADLAREGDAALALHTLGHAASLRWYLPDPLELGVDEAPSTTDLLPGWVVWVFWQALLATGVALVWRARRLGRVVTEPLPVVVRSAETVEGRARLYRVSRSRDRAGALLRTAALRRLAGRLGVPVGAPPQEVARLAAAATGRQENEVAAVLLGAPPRDDGELVALATALDGVEAAVGSVSTVIAGYRGPRVDEGGGARP